MNNTVIIEQLMQSILKNLHQIHNEGHADDSEYVRHVRAALDALDALPEEMTNFINNTSSLKNNLYDYAKALWKTCLKDRFKQDTSPEAEDNLSEDTEYQDYYYDYLYKHGVYPQ